MTPQHDAIDPVCGMTIKIEGAVTRRRDETDYYFCSHLCAGRFDADADAYVAVSRMGLEGWGRTQTPGFLLPEPTADVSRPAPRR